MNRKAWIIGALVCIGSLALVIGCESSSPGAKIFWREQCKECHTIKGKGGAVGPNLTTVGSRRSRDYIVRQITDPRSHNPNTAMPSFKGRLTEQEINELADYLSRLK